MPWTEAQLESSLDTTMRREGERVRNEVVSLVVHCSCNGGVADAQCPGACTESCRIGSGNSLKKDTYDRSFDIRLFTYDISCYTQVQTARQEH